MPPLLLPGGGLLVHLGGGGGGGGRPGTRPSLLTLWPPCRGGRGRTLTSTRLDSFSWSPCTILSVRSCSTSSNFFLLLRPPALSSSPQTEDSRAVY